MLLTYKRNYKILTIVILFDSKIILSILIYELKRYQNFLLDSKFNYLVNYSHLTNRDCVF
jgi:hypothetical protein